MSIVVTMILVSGFILKVMEYGISHVFVRRQTYYSMFVANVIFLYL